MNTAFHRSLYSLFPPVPIFLFVACITLPCSIFAHQLDEYLQATLVVIEPDRIRLQMNLTPGVAISEQVLALFDRDHNNVISTNEAAVYSELLKRDLFVRLDERELKLKLTASYFPGCDELRTGWGFVQLEFLAPFGRLAAGAHTLTIENRHMAGKSVYLVNAAQPASSSIQITRQKRNENQSACEIQFTLQPPPGPSRLIRIVALFIAVAGAVSVVTTRWRQHPAG